MTVWQLVRTLSWKMLCGQVRPGAPVVREWGPWDDVGGRPHYKEVHFTDCKRSRQVPCPHPDPSALNHQMYMVHGEGPEVDVLAMD
jgi:hypothetical protein